MGNTGRLAGRGACREAEGCHLPMIPHRPTSFRRRLVLLTCGLASALSGLAVAVSPSGPDVGGGVRIESSAVELPAGLADLLSDPVAETAWASGAVLAAEKEEEGTTDVGLASSASSPGYRVVWMEVTAYCACTHCCGPNAQGITASGRPVSYNRGRFVAADTRLLPFHTKLSIPGYHGGELVPVLDRGGAIKGNKLDVYFDSHETAKQWGRRWLPVRVYE